MALSMQVTVLCRCEYSQSPGIGRDAGKGGKKKPGKGGNGRAGEQLSSEPALEPARGFRALLQGPSRWMDVGVFGVGFSGIDPAFPPPFGRPLHIAARNGLASVVQALLSRGATVLAVDEEGGCPWGGIPGISAFPGSARSPGDAQPGAGFPLVLGAFPGESIPRSPGCWECS